MKKRQKLVDQLNNPKIDQFVFLLSSKGTIVQFSRPKPNIHASGMLC
jgi:hypothetical protein